MDEGYKAFVIRDLMPDFLHLTEKGHRKWAECLHPVLADWLPSKMPSSAHNVNTAEEQSKTLDTHLSPEKDEL